MRNRAKPHPDFPVGAAVRVKALGAAVHPDKQRLAGRVGVVVRSTPQTILVSFPGEAYREHFLPTHLDLVTDPGA